MNFSLTNNAVTDAISNAYGSIQEWIFANAVGPLLYQFNLFKKLLAKI